MPWRRHLATAVAGAGIWLVLFWIRLATVERSWWIARDDAVITLSHARNAAEFGTIGVSPGGDRVEGYSSPLHFVVAYVLQLGRRTGYETLTVVILGGCLAVIGAVLLPTIRTLARRRGCSEGRSWSLALALTAAIALVTIASWTAAGWMASGMENPLVVAAGSIVAATAVHAPTGTASRFLPAVAVGVFGIARVELAALIVPLVFAVALAQALAASTRRRTTFAGSVGLALSVPLVTHLSRRLYFGEWLPNTALAQERVGGRGQLVVIATIAVLLISLALDSAVASIRSFGRYRPLASTALVTASTVAAGGLVWAVLVGRTRGSFAPLASLAPLAMLGILIVLLSRLRPSSFGAIDHVMLALVAVPVSQYFVMGPARMDELRVVSTAIPFMAVWAAMLAVDLVAPIRLAAVRADPRPLAAALAAGLLFLAGTVWVAARDQPRYLQWQIPGYEQILDVSDRVRRDHLGEALPIVASPDLGKLSFAKRSVIVDLGQLGDPLYTRVARERPDLVTPYLGRVAVPDVVQLHGTASCAFAAWLTSEEFTAGYALSSDRWLAGPDQDPACPLGGRYAVWERRASDEQSLTREIASADTPEDIVAGAIAECAAAPGDAFRCQHVRRSVQRAAQVLRRDGVFDGVVAAFCASPSFRFDTEMLHRGPGWARRAADAYFALHDDQPRPHYEMCAEPLS